MNLPAGPRRPALLQLVQYVFDTYGFLDRARERHGTPLTVRLPVYGAFVMLTDPAAVKDVFTGDPDALHSGEANEFMADTLGPSSLLVLDGDAHARQRRALLPPFHGEQMRAHATAMRAATLQRVETWLPGRSVRLEDECRAITLDVILQTIFGLAGGDEIERFRPRVSAFMDLAGSPFALFSELVPNRLRPLVWAPFLRRLRAVTEPLLERIRTRRAEGPDGADVLSMLFGMTHEDGQPLGDQELRDHLFTLLLAGHDTTAVALGWAFRDLLSHPAVLADVQDELRAACPDGVVDADRLGRLPLLDATIRESLRLHPVVPFVVRRLTRPFTAGGVEYPPGTHLAPCMLLAHRDPELYDDPLSFRPERFLDGRPDPYRWYPFGGGARRCIGMSFALFEMRVVLATILSARRLELRRERVRVRRHGLLLAPSDRTLATVGPGPSES